MATEVTTVFDKFFGQIQQFNATEFVESINNQSQCGIFSTSRKRGNKPGLIVEAKYQPVALLITTDLQIDALNLHLRSKFHATQTVNHLHQPNSDGLMTFD